MTWQACRTRAQTAGAVDNTGVTDLLSPTSDLMDRNLEHLYAADTQPVVSLEYFQQRHWNLTVTQPCY